MTFYGNGIVWDKEKNKRLCKFERGILETADERVIRILVRQGYKHDPDPAPEPEPEKDLDVVDIGTGALPPADDTLKEAKGLEDLSISELRLIADSEGIEYPHNIGAKKLIEKIRQGDKNE